MKNIIFLSSLLFSIQGLAAEQSNFNRSRVSHNWSSSQISSGFDPSSGLGQSYRAIMSLQFDHVSAPYKLIDNDDELLTKVIDSFSRVRLGFGMHLNREWFFGVSIPFDNVGSKPFRQGEQHPNIVSDGFTQSYSGLGDIELLARKRLESLSLRWNWALETLVTLPTGDEDSFNTDGDFSLGVRLGFNKFSGRENQFSTYGFVGAKYSPGSRVNIDSTRYKAFEAEKRFELGFGSRMKLGERLGLFTELSGFLALPFEEGQNPLELSVGGDYTFDKTWKLYGGIGLEGLSGEQFSNDSRAFLGIKKLLVPLSKIQEAEFAKSKYPTYSASYDALLDSVTSETSLVKQIVGKANSAFFVTGSSVLSQEGRLQIIDIASHLIKHQDHIKKVNLTGFTDSTGSRKANLDLSRRRAFEVRNALVEYGVRSNIFNITPGKISSRREADVFGKLGNRKAETYISELNISYLSIPSSKGISYHKNFHKKGSLASSISESLIREELFPRPFMLNGYMVSKFSILTTDNLTWGDVSEKAYGTRRFKDTLRSLNYNRNPALGDIVYFMDFNTKTAKTFEYFKW